MTAQIGKRAKTPLKGVGQGRATQTTGEYRERGKEVSANRSG